MIRFTIHSPETAPEASRPILEQAKKGMGFVPNLYGVLAESPAALKAYTSFSEILQGSDFTLQERNLLWLTVSRANGCTYCVAAHSVAATMGKVPEADIQAIREGKSLSDPRLQALRAFAEAVVETRGWVEAHPLEAFRSAGFSPRQMIEVVAFVSHKTLSNYLNHLAETPLDAPFGAFAWEAQAARA